MFRMFREYKNPKIYKDFKIAKILSLISLILAAVILCEFIIEHYLIKKIAFEFYHIYFFMLFFTIPGNLHTHTSNVFKFRKKSFTWAETKWNNDIINLRTAILLSFLDIILLIFYFLIDLISGVSLFVEFAAYFLGYSFLSRIFSFIAAIFLIHALKLMKKEWKESPPNFYVEEQIEKQQKNIESELLWKQKRCNDLLKKCGKQFFVKYYYQLKKQNLIDVIDIIQENYNESSKKSRIINAKKIFSVNLQIEALNIIIKNEDDVANQTIIDKANSILENETAEQEIQEEKQRIKQEEIKNQEIINSDEFLHKKDL